MYKGQRILVVVPARGGSKGIPLKNIVQLNGIPLIHYVGIAVKEVKFLDRVIASTDSKEIALEALNVGIEVPFYRPRELSGSLISDLEVIKHALNAMEKIDNKVYDVVLMLQPTSPLRKPKHIIETIKKIIDGKYDSVWTINKLDSKYHPLKQLKILDNKLFYYDDRGSEIIARQQITEETYQRNGIAYAFTRDYILNNDSLINKNTGFVITEDKSISIDTYEDLNLASELLKNK